MKSFSFLTLVLSLFLWNAIAVPVPVTHTEHVVSLAQGIGSERAQASSDASGAHYHSHPIDGMSITRKHEVAPGGSVQMTKAHFSPNGRMSKEQPIVAHTMSHTFVDGHGTQHDTHHHVGEDGLLHSEYQESIGGVHMKTTVLHGKGQKQTTDHAFGIHREEMSHHDGSTFTKETHRIGLHTDADSIQANPDITINHSHTHHLGANGDEAVLTSHLHPNGGAIFNGPNAAKDAAETAHSLRYTHDPVYRGMGRPNL